MKVPRVFISYSHDNTDHKKWVLDLAIRLRNNGIDAIIDQWELKPGDDIPIFMEHQLSSSDFIIMVCTERYVEKANKGKGGVGYERMIITSTLMKNINQNKVIPIIKQNGTYEVPIFIKTKLFIDFSLLDDYEINIDNLLRTIHKAPILKKPAIGNNPFQNNNEVDIGKNKELNLKVLDLFYNTYNKNSTGLSIGKIIEELQISRIIVEYLVNGLVKQGLLYHYTKSSGFYGLTNNGRYYAQQKTLP